jgi:cell division protein FtsI (penicillin-binding protein 3)
MGVQEISKWKDGRFLSKNSKGQWKPIRDVNEVDPQDGYDVISTIDVYIQDIAHHAIKGCKNMKQIMVVSW